MGQSVLAFISHSSVDKESFIEPIVRDLEGCYINVWIDRSQIKPGDNLRKSIFSDGLDKADVVLIFFTENSLLSHWVDREIKHVLREETKKGNNFDLNKIISIFDSNETYKAIAERYPELTDDLCHLMPMEYDKIQLGQLVSAIWSKYLSLQGGDVATQKLILEKDKELFQKDKEIQGLTTQNELLKSNPNVNNEYLEFEGIYNSGKVSNFIQNRNIFLEGSVVAAGRISNLNDAIVFEFVEQAMANLSGVKNFFITSKGRAFLRWYLIEKEGKVE